MKIHFTSKMKVHFMGIGGSGVAGVASLASKMGYRVTGCDLEESTAYAEHVFKGHDVKHIKDVDLVVVSPAVFYQNASHPEFLEAKKLKKLITWQEFLGKYLAKDKKVICVAGTHGKSTTTAMIGKVLIDAGLDPSVVLGARVSEWNNNSYFGKGEYLLIEADEFFDNFLNYNPEIIILNNIEFDHPDYFKEEKDVFESFRKFISRLTGSKTLIVNIDSLGVKRLLSSIGLSKINLVKVSRGFDNPEIKLKVFGRHNLQNALGVVALGKVLNLKEELVIKSLESFSGIERRMQLVGDKGQVKVYDDYAHHPTAIKATLEGVREEYPDRRILAVVEAHGFARTKALLNLYKGAFDRANKVIVGPIFKARDKESLGMTPEVIAKESGHRDVTAVDSFSEIKSLLTKEIKKGDVILVMGAGVSYKWAREITELVK